MQLILVCFYARETGPDIALSAVWQERKSTYLACLIKIRNKHGGCNAKNAPAKHAPAKQTLQRPTSVAGMQTPFNRFPHLERLAISSIYYRFFYLDLLFPECYSIDPFSCLEPSASKLLMMLGFGQASSLMLIHHAYCHPK